MVSQVVSRISAFAIRLLVRYLILFFICRLLRRRCSRLGLSWVNLLGLVVIVTPMIIMLISLPSSRVVSFICI